MILDLDQCPDDQSVSCDVCVIGGGAVGIPVAVELAKRNKRVVLLESGGVSLETRAQDLVCGRSVGHPFRNLELGRFRVLGGATTFWGGQVMPLQPHVFESRPWVKGGSWPVDRESLAPYFRKAYDLIGLANVEHDDEVVWRGSGCSPPKLDDGVKLMFTRWVPQRNFAKVFRHQMEQSDRLSVFVHANVDGFAVADGGNVTTVRARSWSGTKLKISAAQVIVAAGAIETARLLLLPLDDGSEAPWAKNAWLGRGFLDHLDSIAGDVRVHEYNAFHNLFDSIYYRSHRYYPKLHLDAAVQKEHQLVDIAAQFIFETAYSEHLANIKMFARSLLDGRAPPQWWKIPQHVLSVAGIAAPLAIRYIKANRSFKPRNARVRLQLYCEQLPHTESQIRLSAQKDALGMPRVDVDWKIDGREIKTCALFARRIKANLEKTGIASVELDPDLEGESERFTAKFLDATHQMSTTRMGLTPQDGVVDTDARVFGTRNLYVAGAAVFPSAGFANPTFTGIALGLRLCDHLARAA